MSLPSIPYALRSTIAPAAVQAVTVLLCFAAGLGLDHLEQLGPTIVILTVVLGMSLARTQRYGGIGHRLFSLAALPVVSVACNEVGRLFVQHPDPADVLFTAAIGLSIWMRRLGPWGTRLGTLIALPFIALLITPVPAVAGLLPSTGRSMLWSAVAAVVAYCLGWIARAAAEHLKLVEPLPRHPAPRTPAAAAARAEPRTGLTRIPASSRMALQMTLSLALAFAIGRGVFGTHWAWIVLTAFIVNSGNRGRGDVVHKSLLRVLGAGVGTVVATVLAGALPPRDAAAIVIILIVLVIGLWLRTISYVYWAGCVTSVLSLLQGYFGEGHVGLIGERLLQIVLGGALAVVIAWLVLPVRTDGVVRRRLADCLAPMTEVLLACLRDPASAAEHAGRFAEQAVLLEQVMPSIKAHRRLHRLRGRGHRHPADAMDAVAGCGSALAALAGTASQNPETLRAPGIPALLKGVTANVTGARRALGRRPEANYRELSAAPATASDAPSAAPSAAPGIAEALLCIDAAARTVYEVYHRVDAPGTVPGLPTAKATAPPLKA